MLPAEILLNSADFTATNYVDETGNHQGGCTYGAGFTISWQRGPLMVDGKPRQNGAFLSTVLDAVIHQLEYVNHGRFRCKENDEALRHLKLAAEAMASRRRDRLQRGVSGTHEV
jgi:hypothetical protein